MAYKFQMGTAQLSGALAPSADNVYDLGISDNQWKDLWIDGRANIDSLTLDVTAVTATGAELNYLDITTLGTAENSKAFTRDASAGWTAAGSTCADLGIVTTVDINGGTADAVVIGGASAAAGTFTAAVATSLSVSDGNITNVGSIALDSITADDGASFAMGSNWTNAGRTVADAGILTTVDINGGSIDATVIGANGALAGTFQALVGTSAVINGTLSCDTSFTLDAVAIDATELGFIDGVTAGTAAASKALVLKADKSIATIGALGCGAITSTGASTYGTMTGGTVSSSAGFKAPCTSLTEIGKLAVCGFLHVSGSTVLGNASGDVVDSLGAVLGLPNLNATTGSTVKMPMYTALGNLETRTRAQFVADIAGTGLSTSGGKLVLSADTTTVTSFANENATLAEGFNYGTATLTAVRTLTLPASAGMAVGDVVQVKVPLVGAFFAKIARAGSQTIDGLTEIRLDSDYGAVSLKYVAADTWRIF